MGEQYRRLDHYQEIDFRGKCVFDADARRPLQLSALNRGLPRLPLYPQHDKELLIVCTGPTVRGEVERIRALHDSDHPILAVKGAHDFLIENDIIPEMAVAIDPRTHTLKYFKHHRDDVKYLLASQCPPELFDLLAERDCWLFHCFNQTTREVLNEWYTSATAEQQEQPQLCIAGGSSTGLRAFPLAHLMGFRKVHVFGMDSCLAEANLRKIYGNESEEIHPKQDIIEVMVEGREFVTDGGFLAQACEFQEIIEHLPDMTFTFYGDGLIQWIAKQRIEKNGCPQCRLPDTD